MAVGSNYAAYLKAAAQFVSAAPASANAWLHGIETEMVSPLATATDARDEAVRQAAFLAGPAVQEQLVVIGRRSDLIGRPVNVSGDRFGYADTPTVFVLGASEQPDGTTILTVYRRLAKAAVVVGAPAMWIAPAAAGRADGADPGNAAPLSALNSMIAAAAAIGGEVRIRADAGVYNQPTALSLSQGGPSAAAPVVIRGANLNGDDAFAEFVGNRAAPWSAGQAYGSDLFRLNSGCDNLFFHHFRFRNLGAGCIRPRQPISNLRIEDVEGFNVGRLIANIAATSSSDATISGLTIRRVSGEGVSKHGIALRYDTHDVLIEDVSFDFQSIDGDLISCGVQLDDTAHDGVVRRATVKNVMNSGPGSYYNGDGLSGERDNANWLYEDCTVDTVSDGGIDHKGNGVVVRRLTAIRCKRSVRLWGDALVEDLNSQYPTTRGGTGASCHIFAMQNGKSRVRVKGGSFIQSNSSAVCRVADNALLVADAAAQAGISAPSGTPFFTLEAADPSDALFGTWDHADLTAPVVNSISYQDEWTTPGQSVTVTSASRAISVPENRPVSIRVNVSENATIETRGPDAGKVPIVGRYLRLGVQDYDVQNGPAADGSKVLKFDVRALDANGNYSAWAPVQVTISDVADDPITPAQAVAASGATDGFWYDVGNAGSLWADTAKSVPAIEGRIVKLVADLTGFGNDLIFPDGAEPVLRTVGGYAALEFDGGSNYGQIGTPGDLRFAQLTAFACFTRDRDDSQGSSTLIFSGLRSSTNTSTSNASFVIGAQDTGYATWRGFSAGNGISGGIDGGATRSVPHLLSFRSNDAVLRCDGGKLVADGADIAALSYPLATQQPLLGARLMVASDGSQYRTAFFQGRFFGAAMLNVACDDATRFRIERQLAASAGVAL